MFHIYIYICTNILYVNGRVVIKKNVWCVKNWTIHEKDGYSTIKIKLEKNDQ